MYWGYGYPYYRIAFTPIWMISHDQALQAIKEAVQDERHDELFYDELIKLAPTAEQAAILSSIRDDERGHNAMFRQMYKDMTGQNIPTVSDVQYPHVTNYQKGIEQAMQGEWKAVEKYRKIWFGLPEGIYRDTVLGIMMDEQKHASKYNYLFTLNR